MPTIFTKIINGDIPGDFVYRDDLVVAFRDINPQARVHILIVPIKEIRNIQEVTAEDESDTRAHAPCGADRCRTRKHRRKWLPPAHQ
ncbi:MAG UNVERIFIED_CONTAM: HIT domain-containing protein [Anaerolineae bacterium]